MGSFKMYVSFAEYSLFYRALLPKKPMFLRSLATIRHSYPTIGASRTKNGSKYAVGVWGWARLARTLQRTATHCNALECTAATHCNALQRPGMHCCNALQHTATPWNALLQRTATPWNALLQRTATHCNALQQRTATGLVTHFVSRVG